MLLGAIWYTHSYEPLELERTRRQCSCGVKHLKDLGAAYEIVRWRREKRRQALFSPQRERVAKSELLSQPQLDHINGSERPRFRLNKPVSSGPQHGSTLISLVGTISRPNPNMAAPYPAIAAMMGSTSPMIVTTSDKSFSIWLRIDPKSELFETLNVERCPKMSGHRSEIC
jgi:hypothetical protein